MLRLALALCLLAGVAPAAPQTGPLAPGPAAYPDLRFEPIGALACARSIALHYRSVGDREAIEVVDLGPDGLIPRAAAHYDDAI